MPPRLNDPTIASKFDHFFPINSRIFTAMGNKLFSSLLLLLLFSILSACKKGAVGGEFVSNYLVGKWGSKSLIEIHIKNGDTVVNDTTSYTEIDSLVFLSDHRFSFLEQTGTYEVDASGENLKLISTPSQEWHIKYLRVSSMLLIQQRERTEGIDRYRDYLEWHLSK